MKTLLLASLAAVALVMSPSAAALEHINVNGTQRAIKVHVPEDGSFDLPVDGTDITLTFDGNVSADGVEAVRAGVSAVTEIGSEGRLPVRKVYFNVCGQHSDVPYAGVNIVKVYYSDGQVETLKRVYR